LIGPCESAGFNYGASTESVENSQAPVAHTCNPSCSGGRDQEDCASKPAGANSSIRPNLEKPFTKIGLVEWLKVKALSSSPSTSKRKERSENRQSPFLKGLSEVTKKVNGQNTRELELERRQCEARF
jgi:hypothetical protein